MLAAAVGSLPTAGRKMGLQLSGAAAWLGAATECAGNPTNCPLRRSSGKNSLAVFADLDFLLERVTRIFYNSSSSKITSEGVRAAARAPFHFAEPCNRRSITTSVQSVRRIAVARLALGVAVLPRT